MNKSKRFIARQRAEQADRYRKQQREDAHTVAIARERIIRQLLASHSDSFDSKNAFVRVIAVKAPKLVKDEYSLAAIEQMGRVAAHRGVEQWQPRGKGYKTLMVSLANHLFAVYPMPDFIWSVFWSEPDLRLARLIGRLAAGTSLHALTGDPAMPALLTKKQCHMLMETPAKFSFVEAIRYVQVMSAGGNLAIHSEWCRSRHTGRLQSREMETFWHHVLNWVCQQRELKPSLIVQLLDYIAHCRAQSGQFNMKGRSWANMCSAMQQWRRLERLRKLAMGLNLPESGLYGANWQQTDLNKRNNAQEQRHWRISEILSDMGLLEEGKAMNHCVYNYRRAVLRGNCSIWSVTCNGKMKLTIEVNNHNRQVVQVKGKSNREPQVHEWKAVRRWAQLNGLRCQ